MAITLQFWLITMIGSPNYRLSISCEKWVNTSDWEQCWLEKPWLGAWNPRRVFLIPSLATRFYKPSITWSSINVTGAPYKRVGMISGETSSQVWNSSAAKQATTFML